MQAQQDHVEEYFAADDPEHQVALARVWDRVVIEGTVLRLPGWRFVGALHHTAEGVIVASVPGQEVPARYFTAGPECDHCGLTRARNVTYVLAHEQGRFAQVGGDCLKDFLGHPDPHALARFAELLGAFNAWCGSLAGVPAATIGYPLEEVLAVSALVVRQFGWTSRSAAKEQGGAVTPTAEYVASYLSLRSGNEGRELRERLGPTTAVETAEATSILAWIEQEEAGDSSYLHNLCTIARAGVVTGRTLGLAVSMRAAYFRAQPALATETPSAYVGVPGTRVELENLRVEAVVPVNGTWGVKNVIRFRDAAGNLLVWFGSGADAFRMEQGKIVPRVRATIGEHKEFRGERETTLMRVKALAAPAPVLPGPEVPA